MCRKFINYSKNSQDCELCDKAKVDKCRKCKKFVCVLFCSIQDPSSDNEIHRIHKPGDRRCNKQNIIESTALNLDHSESDFNPNISQSNGFMSSRFMCPSCENNYGNTWRFEQAYCCYSQWTELTLCSSNSTLLSETEISSASNLDHRKRKINLQTDSSNETSKRKKVEQKNFVCSTCGLSYTVNKNLLRHIRNEH